MIDIHRLRVHADGVQDYFWPLAREDLLAVEETAAERLATLIREDLPPESRDRDVLSIMFKYLLGEVIGTYQAQALVRRFKNHHTSPWNSDATLVSALKSGEMPPLPGLVDALRQGPVGQQTRWAAPWVRRIWRFVRSGGSPFFSILPPDPRSDPITLQVSPLVECHRASEDLRVRYEHQRRWFGHEGTATDPGSSAPGLEDETMATVLRAVEEAFHAGNEPVSKHVNGYLRDWAGTVASLVGYWYETIQARPREIPQTLWLGAGANMWSQILGRACRRAGGTVTTFDHGSSSAWYVHPHMEHREMVSSNRLITFTETAAEAIRDRTRPRYMLTDEMPQIEGVRSCPEVKDPFDPASLPSTLREPVGEIRTIMYPSSGFFGERRYSGAPLPDLVRVDWRARLFANLHRWGYNVLNKPHPTSIYPPHPAFAERFGVRTITGPFEEVAAQGDLFLFSELSSTILGFALASHRPIVLVDFGAPEIHDDAWKLLEPRCALVHGELDGENRAQVDWDDLRTAIQAAPGKDLTDTTFLDAYLRLGGGA